MAKRIVLIQGHPSSGGGHFCHALAEAYAQSAAAAGHQIRRIAVADLDFPILRTKAEWDAAPVPASLKPVQEAIGWAEHLVILYPLWLGSMPALLKAFLEQVFRPGFAIRTVDGGRGWTKLLAGRSARIVITMGMPAFIYRWYFRAHSLKSLERNILGFSGIGPIRASLIGSVEANAAARRRWLDRMGALGRQGR